MKDLVLAEIIEQKIYMIRDQKVMLDFDLAKLYGTTTFRLNEAVKRNKKRFPEDFMFKLTAEEYKNLKSQFAISSTGLRSQIVTSSWGGRRTLPYAFTEQGVAMLSSVLNSDRAIQVNIEIVRTFIKIRKILESHKELIKKLETMEKNYDRQFRIVFQIIRDLGVPKEKDKKQIGFKIDK